MCRNFALRTLIKNINKNWHNRTKHHNNGFVLPFSTVLVLLLTLIGYGLLSLGFEARANSSRKSFEVKARAAADAGLIHALYKMNNKLASELIWSDNISSLAETDVTLPNSSATYSFSITGNSSTGYTIQSTGQAGNITKTVYSTTKLASIFDFALLMKSGITLYANSSVEAFNSSSGASGIDTKIAVTSTSSGSIVIKNNAIVQGGVFVGLGANPDQVIDNKGTITGSQENLSQLVYFPKAIGPASLPSQGSITSSVSLTPSESGIYSYINLKKNNSITVEDGEVVLYITGDITFNKNTGITIESDASLVLYLDGNLESKNDVDINVDSGVPGNLMIIGTGEAGQELVFKAKSDFYGVVYAPEADVEIKAKGDIYGSVVGNSYESKSKSSFYYDTALGDLGINDEGAYFAVENWREE